MANLLDFDALTAPIPGDQPAGFRVPADVRKKMEDARKDFEPDPNNPSAPPIPKKPDWPAIVKLASDSLSKTSKDLLAAVRLVEALAKRDGFAGVRDGFKLLRLLSTACWDRIHPLIEGPEDIESRAGPFQWLGDAESGAWFPTTVSKQPLVKVNGQFGSLDDWKKGQLGDQPFNNDTLVGAEPASATTAAELTDALTELQGLDQALTEKMADQAPALGNVRDVLTGCQNLLNHLNASGGGEAEPEPGADGAAPQAGAQKSAAGVGRAETYRQLALLADQLAKLEPHSPIPDLLRWAVKLGNMPFRQLIQELVREPNVLADIRRQFGIPEEAAAPPE
jgi:type VI secretion system protein ImpA